MSHFPRVRALLFVVLFLSTTGFVLAGPQAAPQQPISSAALAEKLPVDPDVTTGTLPNGLKYYVRKNALPEKRAELRLVVNAGSLLEEDDQ